MALYNAGRIEALFSQATDLVAEYPQEPDLHNILGMAARSRGNLVQAVEHYERALVLSNNAPSILNNLGNALRDLGRFERALDSFDLSIAASPNAAGTHSNKAAALSELGRHAEAAAACELAVQLSPDYAAAHFNLGIVLAGQKKVLEAITCYKRAIALQANYARAQNNLGALYNQLGSIPEAIECFKQAIRLKPNYISPYRNLFGISTFTPDESELQQVETMLESGKCSEEEQSQLRFALGSAYDRMGDVDASFAHLQVANRLKRVELNYDPAGDQALFAKLMKARFLPLNEQPALPVQPVFILGLPRSGTTLVEQILASHSQVYGAGELTHLSQTILDMGVMRAALPAKLTKIRSSYTGMLAELAGGKPYITDKLPSNFLLIGHILSAMPEAKIIHVRRHPWATCWSIYKHHFTARGLGFAYDLEDLTRYHQLYRELMQHWSELFPGKIYELNYELLTEDQHAQTELLLDYLGLEWESQCMAFHETTRSVATASSSQVNRKMYQGSSNAWELYREYLEPAFKALPGRIT